MIKPPPLRPRSRAASASTTSTIDPENRTVTCPDGITVDEQAQPGPLRSQLRRLPAAVHVHQRPQRPGRQGPPPAPAARRGRRQATTAEFQDEYRRCGPWSNAPWPGSPEAPAAKSATGASNATSCGGPTAAPRSTWPDSSPSASPPPPTQAGPSHRTGGTALNSHKTQPPQAFSAHVLGSKRAIPLPTTSTTAVTPAPRHSQPRSQNPFAHRSPSRRT